MQKQCMNSKAYVPCEAACGIAHLFWASGRSHGQALLRHRAGLGLGHLCCEERPRQWGLCRAGKGQPRGTKRQEAGWETSGGPFWLG